MNNKDKDLYIMYFSRGKERVLNSLYEYINIYEAERLVFSYSEELLKNEIPSWVADSKIYKIGKLNNTDYNNGNIEILEIDSVFEKDVMKLLEYHNIGYTLDEIVFKKDLFKY